MKIVKARIRNFKLLRDLSLTFSMDRNKPLTVIRAENGSGKTSTLQALRWALFGKNALEDSYDRLSPANWPDQNKCQISVEIDFIHSGVSKVGNENKVSEEHYMLKREVVEKPDNDHIHRGKELVTMYQSTDAGSVPVDPPEIRLAQMLPKEMVDIFFIDGDKAMSFISPTLHEGARRDKVKDAIRTLLGLGLLERVEKRVDGVQSDVNSQISKNASSEKLSNITEEIERKNMSKQQFEKKIADSNTQIKGIEQYLYRVKQELDRALEFGKYKHLAVEKKGLEEELKAASMYDEVLKKNHQKLFQEEALSWSLIGTSLHKGFKRLQRLHVKGALPGELVPALKERLELEKCICGASLREGTLARKNVITLIQRRGDEELGEHLSYLYYNTKGELDKQRATGAENWKDKSQKLSSRRTSCEKNTNKLHDKLKYCDAKISKIDQKEINFKEKLVITLTETLQKKNSERDQAETMLHTAMEKLKDLKIKQKILSQADKKVAGLNAEKTVLDDLEFIVSETLKKMQGIYIELVSKRMNDLFIEVCADTEQDGGFLRAEISDKYSIVVRTTNNRTLHPDHEVNSASQRALTFAFIWALTEVSDVVAPRVIDTPLGMMSGNVKRRVLEMISKAADGEVDRQVILFLTQSEISHTEDILDERAGKTITLIKTGDYPKDLVNNPGTDPDQPVVLACECTHRQFCVQCERTNSLNYQLNYRSE